MTKICCIQGSCLKYVKVFELKMIFYNVSKIIRHENIMKGKINYVGSGVSWHLLLWFCICLVNLSAREEATYCSKVLFNDTLLILYVIINSLSWTHLLWKSMVRYHNNEAAKICVERPPGIEKPSKVFEIGFIIKLFDVFEYINN